MPWSPWRTCPRHRLRLPIRQRCPACAQEYDRARPPDHYRFLTGRRWRLLRAQVLDEEPWCACGCGRPSTEVDHIQSRLTHPELIYARSNLQALAAECHGRKSRRERARGSSASS